MRQKEEKPYPIIDEEDGSCLSAQEPIADAVAYAEETEVSIPGLLQSWDELLECITEGEQELERGEAIPWICRHMRMHPNLPIDIISGKQ